MQTRLTLAAVLAVMAHAALPGAAPASAQSTVYLALPGPSTCQSDCDAQLLRVEADAPAVTGTWTLPASGVHEPLYRREISVEYVTPDGGLVVWIEPRRISPNLSPSTMGVLDIATGTTQVIRLTGEAHAIVGNPRRAEIYVAGAPGPLAIGPGGARPLSGPACAGGSSQPLVASADGRRVLFSCSLSVAFGDVFVVDTASVASVGARRIESIVPALSADGRDLFTVESGMLRRYAVEGGPVLAEAALPVTVNGQPESIELVRVDPRTGGVFAIGVGVHVFDPVTLHAVQSAVGVWTNGLGGRLAAWTFDPDRPRAYVTTQTSSSGTSSHGYWALDTDHLSLVWSHQIAQPPTPAPGRFLIAPRPAAPVSLTASVVGSAVTFTWASGVSNATVLRHVVEAGSAPGLNDIVSGLEVGPQTSLAASGVPPGRYYVRVRAGNVTGLSAPSSDVVVQVP